MKRALKCEEQWMCVILCFPLFLPTPIMSLKPEVIHFRSLALQMQNQSDQALALLAFKHNSVSADPKGFLADWTPGNLSLCSWHGVICSPPGQVNALNFTNAGLAGHLHINDLIVLENLQHLYFSGNSFSSDLLLNSSSDSCALKTLDLSINKLSEWISETFFTACKHLVSVNLSHNSIPGGSFNFGPSLVQLDLSNNQILDFSMCRYFSPSCQAVNLQSKFSAKPDSFLDCRNLSVPGGNFSTIIPSYIRTSLKYLDVSHNNLSGNFSMLKFGSCASLQVLNLSNNALYGTGIPQSLTNCQLLKNLDLSYNKLQGKIPIKLGQLRNLTSLTLANNNFSGEIPPELNSTCGTLQDLDLFGNNLSGGLPDSFTSCNQLQRLNLGQNQLSSNFLNTISVLPKLKILEVPFNNITGPIPMSLRTVIIAGGYLAFKTGWVGYELSNGFFPFGVNGMLAGSAVVFFSYIGFDAVTSAAEEVSNEKDMKVREYVWETKLLFPHSCLPPITKHWHLDNFYVTGLCWILLISLILTTTLAVFYKILIFGDHAEILEPTFSGYSLSSGEKSSKDLPLGIGMALSLCCILYMLVSIVIVGLVPYYSLNPDTPISSVFSTNGMQWAVYVTTTGASTALCASLLGSLLPQPRVLMAMARDGLLPSFFSDINKHTKVPVKSTVTAGTLAAVLALLMDVSQLSGMVSVGTLLAYTAVAISVLILRYAPPDEVPFPSSLQESIDSVRMQFSNYIQETEIKNFESDHACDQSFCFPENSEASIQCPLIQKQVAEGKQKQQQRRKIAAWNITLVCIGVLVLASAASAERLPSLLRFALCATGAAILLCSLIVLACINQDDARHNFGHTGGFLCPFVPFLPSACILVNTYLLINLGAGALLRVSIWLIIGALIYLFYGRTHSSLINAIYVPVAYADEIHRASSSHLV